MLPKWLLDFAAIICNLVHTCMCRATWNSICIFLIVQQTLLNAKICEQQRTGSYRLMQLIQVSVFVFSAGNAASQLSLLNSRRFLALKDKSPAYSNFTFEKR